MTSKKALEKMLGDLKTMRVILLMVAIMTMKNDLRLSKKT